MIWPQNILRILDVLVQEGRIITNDDDNAAILRRSDGCEEKLAMDLVEMLDTEGLIAAPFDLPCRQYSATDECRRLMECGR